MTRAQPLPAAGVTIEAAARADLDEILSNYNEVIRHSTAVYSETELSAAQGAAWLDAKAAQGYPFLVARAGPTVVGFATFGDFRPWPCYAHTVEHSFHVHAEHRGRGIGHALLVELLTRARGQGKHVMIAGVDAANLASIRLHEKLGFHAVGRLREVGYKFGRWLDLTLLQRII